VHNCVIRGHVTYLLFTSRDRGGVSKSELWPRKKSGVVLGGRKVTVLLIVEELCERPARHTSSHVGSWTVYTANDSIS